MSVLRTERTMLRRFQLSDFNNMVLLESDPDVMKFTPSRFPLPPTRIEERLKSVVEKEKSLDPLGFWALELRETSEFVGWFMLISSEFDVPEIGFMIVRKHWGKGYAKEAARALLDYAMKTLKFPIVQALTDGDNFASIQVLKKLGFQKVDRRLRFDKTLGREVEGLIFELNRKPG